jgi:NhaP-type Na+/H+ or K+/H+ antiporter
MITATAAFVVIWFVAAARICGWAAVVAYLILQQRVVGSRLHSQEGYRRQLEGQTVAGAVCRGYSFGLLAAMISLSLYVFGALLPLIPERRIEKALRANGT